MIIINSNSGLASFALMRELANNKKGVFDVLREFIIYCEKDKSDFLAEDVVKDLEEYFNFVIPISVIYNCLFSFPEGKMSSERKRKKRYFTLKDVETSIEFKEIQQFNEKSNEVIKDLNIFLKNELKDESLTIESTYEDYYYYTTDKHEKLIFQKIEAISKFILSKKEEKSYIEIIDKIQEGCLIYMGLINCNDCKNIGSWRQNITLFLDTEILLSAYGFNGSELQSRFSDFYQLVEEINKNKKGTIKLKYFEENKEEINSIFLTVEKFFDSSYFFAGKTAFFKIKMEAKKKENVPFIKHKFIKFLKDKEINEYEESINIVDPKNHKFNLIDQSSLETYSKKYFLEIKKIEETLTFFTKINILRSGFEVSSLEKSKYLFVTLNSKTYYMAIQEKEKREKKVAEAANLHFFTVYMWFKLNKGFTDGKEFVSFKSISKASLIIKGLIGNTFTQKLNELKEEEENKEFIPQALADLMNKHYTFETNDNINEAEFLEELSSFNINKIIEENEKQKEELIFALKEVEKLRKEKLEKEELEKEKLEKEKLEKEKLEKEKLEKEKLEKEELEKVRLEKEKNKKIKKRCIAFVFLILGFTGIYKLYYDNNLIIGIGVISSIYTIFPAIKDLFNKMIR